VDGEAFRELVRRNAAHVHDAVDAMLLRGAALGSFVLVVYHPSYQHYPEACVPVDGLAWDLGADGWMVPQAFDEYAATLARGGFPKTAASLRATAPGDLALLLVHTEADGRTGVAIGWEAVVCGDCRGGGEAPS
jgi:hypothetical protein